MQDDESGGGDTEKNVSGNAKKYLELFLRIKIPIWVIIVLLVISGGYVGYRNLTTDGPTTVEKIATNAPKLSVNVTMCNARVDKLNLNLRKEELRLIKRFEDVEKVEVANVHIAHHDCTETETQK